MGLGATKAVFGISRDKARLKPISSVTETSQKIESSFVATLDIILSKKVNNKVAGQSARMRRLVCAFVVRKPRREGSSRQGPLLLVTNHVLHKIKYVKERRTNICHYIYPLSINGFFLLV